MQTLTQLTRASELAEQGLSHTKIAAYQEMGREFLIGVVRSKIVLLDSDTGIAPTKPSGKHVTPEDMAAVREVLRTGDWLAVYQHQSRSKTWKHDARDRFARVCGNDVEVYSAPRIASGVLFLARRKP